MRLFIKTHTVIIAFLYIILLSILIQKFFAPTNILKVIQVLFSTLGNLVLIIAILANYHIGVRGVILVLIIIINFIYGLLIARGVGLAIIGLFPFINLASFTLCLGVLSKKKVVNFHLNTSERFLFLVTISITFLLILLDYHEHWYRVLTYRTSGLIFKPSSGGILLSVLTLLYFRKVLTQLILHLVYLFCFKAMSIAAILSISFTDIIAKRLSGKLRIILLFVAVVLCLILVYLLNLVYQRSLWVSVGTRLDILQTFDIFGGGLGYGTNISINALSLTTPVSDGTINLIKYQFGIVGFAWISSLLLLAALLAMGGHFLMAGLLALCLVGFNIPEIPMLSLLLPYVLFRMVQS